MSNIIDDIDLYTAQYMREDPDLSDLYMQHCEHVLSDERLKYLREGYENNSLDPDALSYLLEQANIPEEDRDAEDVLEKYAEHLHNYLYTYKEDAVNIDPSINPNEEHIGIMAQDLEQVNPACVKETSNGVKVVDTGRLALMNAGAIADIARRLISLEGVLHK